MMSKQKEKFKQKVYNILHAEVKLANIYFCLMSCTIIDFFEMRLYSINLPKENSSRQVSQTKSIR